MTRIDDLSPEQRELLARRLANKRAQASAVPPLVENQRGERPPLSHAQERMWFLQQLDPTSAANHVITANRLRGPLDAEALRRAFEDLVGRHEALRTTFHAENSTPYQTVLPSPAWELAVEDWQGLEPAALDQLVREEVMRPFDLARDLPLRTRLGKVGADVHLLVVTLHHIAIDHGSFATYWRDLDAAYRGHLSGRSAELPPLRVQYPDYAAWLRSWLSGSELERQLRYWKERLRGIPDEAALPYRRPRPPAPSARGELIATHLTPELSARVLALGRHQGATAFMTLLAALRALLARYCRQDDIVIAAAIDDRSHRELEGLIGLFINTLLFRNRVDPHESFSALVAREKTGALEALQHNTPFELIVDAVGVVRSLGRTPLFQVMFQHFPKGRAVDRLGDLAIEPFGDTNLATQLELTVTSMELDDHVVLRWHYKADVFDRERVEQMARDMVKLLDAVTAAPERPLSELAWIDRSDVLDAWRQPVPLGVIGELYRDGTATGELARRTHDGFERIGRRDDELWIDGCPVELPAIARILVEHPSVREALVVGRDDGTARLVAYVVPDRGFDAKVVRADLASKLPHYMVPAAFVTLERLPADRAELPAPDETLVASTFLAPRNPEEEKLAEIWTHLLGLSRVGVRDDFFAAGGSSLLAIRLVAEIERAFAVRLPLRQVFAAPTIEGLAAEIRAARHAGAVALARPPLVPTDARTARLLAPQRGTYRLDQDSRSNRLNRPTWSVWFDGPVDVRALERALAALRARHGILRTRFYEADGELWQEVLDTVPHPLLEQVDLSAASVAEQEREIAELNERFMLRPFDLAAGEVMRSLLVALSPQRHRFTLLLHRIACDDESLRVIVEELARLWQAFTDDPAAAAGNVLPPVPLQYIDLADYLARLASSDAGEQQRAYWQARLADAPPLELPIDRPRDAVEARRDRKSGFVTFPVAFTEAALEGDLVQQVQQLARQERASLKSTLLSAMAAHLSQVTGQTDLAIVSHLIYRHLPGLERAPGLFSNPLVMRISADGAPTPRELVRHTHDVVTTAFENGECDVLGIASHRMFRLWFNFLYAPPAGAGGTLPLPRGVTATYVPIPGTNPQMAYDLLLFVHNDGDRIGLRLAYSLELFTEAGAAGLLRGYVEQIERMCRAPDVTAPPRAPASSSP